MSKDERFTKLYSNYHPKLVRFFVREGCTIEEARDHAQEALLRVYRSMDAFRDQSSLGTWTYKIARNLWLNELRYWRSRGGRNRTRPLDDGESAENGKHSTQYAASDPGPFEVLEQNERMRLLGAAIGELPQQQRVCMRFWLMGHKYREIAQMTGKSIETVKSLLHEAKAKLRLRLGGELPDFDESDEENEP